MENMYIIFNKNNKGGNYEKIKKIYVRERAAETEFAH